MRLSHQLQVGRVLADLDCCYRAMKIETGSIYVVQELCMVLMPCTCLE